MLLQLDFEALKIQSNFLLDSFKIPRQVPKFGDNNDLNS